MNRDMLSRRLTRRDHEILLAFDGQEGLEKMRSEKPELVLMDMGLPVLDGWEATTQAKADEELKSIPIIALTAHALEEDRKKAIGLFKRNINVVHADGVPDDARLRLFKLTRTVNRAQTVNIIPASGR